jgi:hypothetical protein
MIRPCFAPVALAGFGLLAALTLSDGPGSDRPAAVEAAAASGTSIDATYGVGGVGKSDGRRYQWRPEKERGVTIDESFRLDGETRKIHPLPVVAGEVARMEGFGFIVTRSGTCWLYNLDSNLWENIGRP